LAWAERDRLVEGVSELIGAWDLWTLYVCIWMDAAKDRVEDLDKFLAFGSMGEPVVGLR